MEQVVVVGNCQAAALEIMLRTNDAFTDRFEFTSFPPVHEIPAEMVIDLHVAVAGADLAVLQRIDDGYRDNLGLGTETLAGLAGAATVVRWPSVYWAGYFPDLFYLRDAAGQPVVDGPFDYHDRTVLEAYATGLSVADTARLLEDPTLPSDADLWAANATAELEIRGEGCDVEVASFIASRFRQELLFFTMNHPANALLCHIAQQVTNLIGVPGLFDCRNIADQVLGSTFYPLHANHVRSLQLGFGDECAAGSAPFRIRGVVHQSIDAVRMFFDYYTAHPELVTPNLDAGGR